jgi:aminopeptidase N
MKLPINGLEILFHQLGGENCKFNVYKISNEYFDYYRWLKEGFASYMETLASDNVEPSWMQDERFVVEKIFSFMDADSLPTSRPISIQSTNPADIFQLFDSITYDKGATLIRMMSMFLGEKVFQKGIQNYLNAFSYSSATQEDLWRYLSNATDNKIDVERIMHGWTTQAGYPVLEVNREYALPIDPQKGLNSGGQIVIIQRPFNLFSSTIKEEKWWIPFKYFDRTSTKVRDTLLSQEYNNLFYV